MGLKTANYEDHMGRKWRVFLPVDASDEDAREGIPAGPPSLAALELPVDVEVRLHNELHHRGLFSEKDLRHRRPELQAALMAALRLDVERLQGLYGED